MKKVQKIKVGKKVKPVAVEERKLFDLIIGQDYFVSFGNNVAWACRLIAMDARGISVLIPRQERKHKGLPYVALETTNHLFRDEIGRTPEEAVLHEVTF